MAQKKPKKVVIRVGDRVRILNSKLVKRVGYPTIWTDIVEVIASDPRTMEAYTFVNSVITEPKPNVKQGPIPKLKFTVTSKSGNSLTDTDFGLDTYASDPHFKDFCRVIAQMKIRDMRFGGNERKIHYYPTAAPGGNLIRADNAEEERSDYTGHVVSVIGKRIAKTGDRFAPSYSYSGYDDGYDEPGGLANEQTHILLDTSVGLIEERNVELVERGSCSVKLAIMQVLAKLKSPISVDQLAARLPEHAHIKQHVINMLMKNEIRATDSMQLLALPQLTYSALTKAFEPL